MTSQAATVPRDAILGLRGVQWRWRPAEGWVTVALLVVMGLLAAWAIDDAAWVLGQSSLTDFLTWAAVGGMIVGFVGAKVGWSRWTTHLIGITLGALIVPIMVGSVLLPDGGSLYAYFHATADAVVQAWLDLFIRGQTVTREYGHFLLVLGLLIWATCQFAMFAAFRHRRPVAATMVLGLVLLVNVSATLRDQLVFLVAFTIAALLLLIRLHAFDEQRAWLRNRIGDPATVSAMYLRGGSVFVTVAVVGALFLTVSASSAPLKGAWSGADAWLIDAGRGLQRYFSFVQSVRGPTGVDFGPSAHITGKWATDSDVAVTIEVPPGSPATYWRAAAYDVYDGSGWVRSGDTRVDRGAGQQILEGTLDAPTAAGHVAVTVEVTPVGYGGTNVFSPGDVGLVDLATTLRLVGHDNHNSFYSTVEVPSSHTTYEVTGYVPTLGVADPKDLTKNKLRAAGTDYPADVVATYVTGGVPTGAIGPDARKLLEQLRARVPDGNPYDLAQATVDTLQSGVYHYDTDVHDLDCSKIGIVECFARYKRGYCQYYATTMAILLRAEGIPTRLVQGFLPTDRRNNVETLLDSNSHAWVQVYFPKFGWVDFDPTGGNVSRLPVIPNGPPVSIPPKTPKPSGTDEVNPSRPIGQPSGSTVPIGSTGGPGGAGSGPFILIALVLGLSVLAFAFVTYRRGPRSASPDQAWRGVTRLAGRLGFAPRPTQTVYEYAGVLGDLIPVARPHLDTVAAARVEVVYGRRELGDDRLRALRESVGRLRIALLRLAFRRRERRAYRRGRRPGAS